MFEIATLILLAGNVCEANHNALEIIQTESVVENINPSVCLAIERLAKQKHIHGATMWSWDTEESCQNNLVFMRKWYFEVNKLPPLELIKLLPPKDYVNSKRVIVNNALAYLEKLKTMAAPWELDNIQLLIEETTEIQTYWEKAHSILRLKDYSDSELWCRVAIQELQNMFDTGDIQLIWQIPCFPMWRWPTE